MLVRKPLTESVLLRDNEIRQYASVMMNGSQKFLKLWKPIGIMEHVVKRLEKRCQ